MAHTTYKPESLVMPFVHINGTSGQALLDLREAVWAALEKARHALQDMAPNGRDYCPYNDPTAMKGAIAQHQRRERVLNELQDELTAEREHISQFVRTESLPSSGNPQR